MKPLYVQNKKVWISVHAITQARKRRIAFPDQVYDAIKSGKVARFGKHGIKFIKRGRKSSIVCIGEDLGPTIVIKTVARGN
jgi:hypothetical protein